MRKRSNGVPMKARRQASRSRLPFTKAGPVTIKRIDPETGELEVVTEKAYSYDQFRQVVKHKK